MHLARLSSQLNKQHNRFFAMTFRLDSKIAFYMVLLAIALTSCSQRPGKIQSNTDFVDLVYPHVDAANSRWFFFSSASRPFGMVNLSPDMVLDGTWGSGYRYYVDTIRGFSHIHEWQLSGVPVLPVTGEFKGHLGADVYGSSY